MSLIFPEGRDLSERVYIEQLELGKTNEKTSMDGGGSDWHRGFSHLGHAG
jgi:hypothetical protein